MTLCYAALVEGHYMGNVWALRVSVYVALASLELSV